MMRSVVLITIVTIASIAYVMGQQVSTPPPTALVCAYNTTPTTVTNAQFVYVQCDNHGYLLTKAAP